MGGFLNWRNLKYEVRWQRLPLKCVVNAHTVDTGGCGICGTSCQAVDKWNIWLLNTNQINSCPHVTKVTGAYSKIKVEVYFFNPVASVSVEG